MSRTYVPDAGDIVWLQFTPQAGHEQAGHRPALVLSPAVYNAKTSLMLCCPMTTQAKNYPFEVPLGDGTSGVDSDRPYRSKQLFISSAFSHLPNPLPVSPIPPCYRLTGG
ncbi:MAG TPA: type II toxin-antitoxin system PemK/MazF family toxin [Bryobacteraceae bacterium]|nr:type II toxin-antitoxin system PemK/MazF family toxin [Bryobacteraceae bacterium]